jgi:DNA-binding phage protein
MNEIEGLLFSAEMNLAAGKKAFSRNMQEHALFGQLREFAKTPEGRTSIIKRVSDLAAQSIDTRYEHPADVAFSAYLTILDETAGPEIVAQAASAVMATRNCAWAVGVSRELLTKAFASGGANVSISSNFQLASAMKTFKVYRGHAVSLVITQMVESIAQTGNLEARPRLLSLVTTPTGRSETAAAGNADESLAPSRKRRRTGRGHRSPPHHKYNPGRHGQRQPAYA